MEKIAEENWLEKIAYSIKGEAFRYAENTNTRDMYDTNCKIVDYCTQLYKQEEENIIRIYSEELPGLKEKYPTEDHKYMLILLNQMITTLAQIRNGKTLIKPFDVTKNNLGILEKWLYFINRDEPKAVAGQVAMLNRKGERVLEDLIKYIQK